MTFTEELRLFKWFEDNHCQCWHTEDIIGHGENRKRISKGYTVAGRIKGKYIQKTKPTLVEAIQTVYNLVAFLCPRCHGDGCDICNVAI